MAAGVQVRILLGDPGAPAFHLRRLSDGGLFETYANSVEHTWENALTMGRIDYLHDPDALPANSVVPSAVAFVQNGAGEVLMRSLRNENPAIFAWSTARLGLGLRLSKGDPLRLPDAQVSLIPVAKHDLAGCSVVGDECCPDREAKTTPFATWARVSDAPDGSVNLLES